jgi:hypothetical protein
MFGPHPAAFLLSKGHHLCADVLKNSSGGGLKKQGCIVLGMGEEQ